MNVGWGRDPSTSSLGLGLSCGNLKRVRLWVGGVVLGYLDLQGSRLICWHSAQPQGHMAGADTLPWQCRLHL